MVTLERERENNTSLLHRLSGSSATFTFFRRAAQLSCSVVILVAQPVGSTTPNYQIYSLVRITALSSLIKSYLSVFGKVSQSRAGQVLSILKLSPSRQREREG